MDQASVTEAIFREFDINVRPNFRRAGGYSSENYFVESDDRRLVLKVFKVPIDEVVRIESVVAALSPMNGRVIPALMGRNSSRHFSIGDRLAALYPRVPGVLLHENTITEFALTQAGEGLAEFHDLARPDNFAGIRLPGCSDRRPRAERIKFQLDQARALRLEIPASADRDDAISLLEMKVRLLECLPEVDSASEPDSIIHGDFHNENLIFASDSHLVAILDFENVRRGRRLEDVFHFVSLCCCNTGFTSRNLEKAARFLRGYSRVLELHRDEVASGFFAAISAMASSNFIEAGVIRDSGLRVLLDRDFHRVEFLLTHFSEVGDRLLRKLDELENGSAQL